LLQDFHAHAEMTRRFPRIDTGLHQPGRAAMAQSMRCSLDLGFLTDAIPHLPKPEDPFPSPVNYVLPSAAVHFVPSPKERHCTLGEPHWRRPLRSALALAITAPAHYPRRKVNSIPGQRQDRVPPRYGTQAHQNETFPML